MDDIKVLLDKIKKVYNSELSNDEKHGLVSQLWTEYYVVCKQNNIFSEKGYFLSLEHESDSYIINQSPIRIIEDDEEVKNIVLKLKNNINNNLGISYDEAIKLLNWDVENTRRVFDSFGLDVSKSSLNGFCEIGQAISIMPFENIGLKVTKNLAKDAFNYPFNHSFGTVTIPIDNNGIITDYTFLIDTTYRQFFSSSRCNLGRYLVKDEILGVDSHPDPGFFVKDKNFAKELMGYGYVLLNSENAKKYGEAFYLSSLDVGQISKSDNIDYYNNILTTGSNYNVHSFDIYDLNKNFPGDDKKTSFTY